MSTSGSFTPASIPPCPAPMTRAALLALRTAAALRTECHYLVTDAPVIGTAGNTSPTTVELHAVSAAELALEAKVHQTFDTEAWEGLYDIDLGAAGTFLEIRDASGNVVRSTVADAPTVQTSFPWHLTPSGQVRNNYIEESTLTGWGAIATTVRGNQISRNSTVALTGNWGIFTDNRIENSTVNLLHAAGATRTFTGNTVRGGASFQTTAGASGSWTVTDTDFLDGYVMSAPATSTGAITIDGSRFEGHGATATDALFDLGGTKSFNNVRSVTSGAAQQYTWTGTGTVSVTDTEVIDGRIIRNAATTANLTVSGGARITGLLTQTANATSGALTLTGGSLDAGFVNHTSAAAVTITNCDLIAPSIVMTTGGTRALTMTNTSVQAATINQARTGGTGVDTITNSVITGTGTSLLLNGATDPGGSQTVLDSCRISEGGTLTLTNPAGSGGLVMQSTVIDGGAVLTGTGTVQVTTCRFSAGCTVTLGAFTHDHSIVEGNLTVTPTASNSNRLANKSFSDWT